MGQRVDDLLGDAVDEVLLLGVRAQVWPRWRASFSRQPRMMRARSPGRSVRTSVIAEGVSRRIEEATSAEDRPWKGRWPVAISYSMMPSEKMSVRCPPRGRQPVR